MCMEQAEFYEIFNIFNREDAVIWEKSLNNMILVKLEENLNRIAKFPEDAYATNPIALVIIIKIITHI
jgi:hypothetical protein